LEARYSKRGHVGAFRILAVTCLSLGSRMPMQAFQVLAKDVFTVESSRLTIFAGRKIAAPGFVLNALRGDMTLQLVLRGE
jgi:hypothetical protein